MDGVGVAAVFAAHSEYEVGARRAAFLGGGEDEPADSLGVERLER